jgi:hypothetical protein
VSTFGPDLSAATDPREWEWIAPGLGTFGTVGGLVPAAFDRCVRIDHGDDEAYDGWGLPAEIVDWFARHAASHTTTPDRALFAIWEGYGWLNSTMLTSRQRRGRFSFRRGDPDPFASVLDEFDQRQERLAAELDTLPRLQLPSRTYLVLTGRLGAARTIHDPVSPPARRPPDLWWPADRAWFVASDTDLTWTYVAGSVTLTEQIRAEWPDRVRYVTAADDVE